MRDHKSFFRVLTASEAASPTTFGPPAFLDLDADESVTVMQDYFYVRRWGIFRDHTVEGYRSFRVGYHAGAPKEAQDVEPVPTPPAPTLHRSAHASRCA
jgi:hypothetical protein